MQGDDDAPDHASAARRERVRRTWLLGGFAAALLLFAFTAWLVQRQNTATTAASQRVAHTLEVLQGALELDAEILLMESDHRAWLVRGDDAFLAARDARRDAALALIAQLQADTADNPGQQERLRLTREMLVERHARMEQSVAAAAEGGLEAARDRFRTRGDGSLVPLRAQLASIRGEERRLLHERARQAADGAVRLRWTLLYGPGAGLLVLFIAGRALLAQLARAEHLRGELADAEAVQRAMLDGAGHMIIGVHPDGVIRLFNRAAAENLGYSPEELVGRQTPALFHDPIEVGARAAELSAELGRPVDGFEAFVAGIGDGGVDEREWTYIRRDGSRFPVQLAVSAVRDSGGAPIGYIGVAQDISLRQAADREIRDLNQTLQQTVGELESFSYSVSHDLRAPLRHIDGYSRMLIDDLGDRLDEEPRRFLDSISRSSRRMGQLIDDLLSLSRLGRKALARQAVDMTLLAEETWKEVAVDMRSEAEFVLAPLPTISGDPALLRQVWLNLLSNAAKYSARKGAEARIEVSAVRDEDTVTYHVKDNGVGFDSRYADKLFGVFQRLHAQDEFEGTGVGLAIVHRIVVRHGGTVSAEAEPGIGAHFSFALPDREIE